MENKAFRETLQAVCCHTEYESLNKVITVSPQYMQIKEVINETQAHYLRDNIDIEKAVEQHSNFIVAMEQAGADVIKLDARKHLNEQVFTRDIGFSIGNKLFVSSMKEDIRKEEQQVLIEWLEDHKLPYYPFKIPSIEGGDVLVDRSKVWVGNSDRTTLEAINLLQTQLPDYEVTSINLQEDILHLDCIFNIIGNKTALIYPEGMDTESYNLLKNNYTLIEVTKDEQFHLGPNVLSLGNKKVISLPDNDRLNNLLREAGFETIEIPFSEIIKSGGSFRCCTLPLQRGN